MKTKIFILLLLMLVFPSFIGFSTPPINSDSSINLNTLMLENFLMYDAMLTSQLDINGTLIDPYDMSQAPTYSETTVSAYISIISFASFYDSTGDEYYLRKLQFLVDQIIADSWFRATPDPTPPAEVIYCPQYWYDGSEHDSTPKITMFTGIAAVKLYQWTGLTKYKTLADQIASQSLQMAVVNNSTDMAWSWAYYKNRDLASAKTGVNRQGSIAYFYAVYGDAINSAYSAYVPKIVNWIWRSQVAGGGLTYSIGTGSAHSDYSAYCLYFALSAYNYASSEFDATLKTKMDDTLTYLQTGIYGQSPFYYAHAYIASAAHILAVKTGFTASPTQEYLDRAKTMIYSCLEMVNVREKGLHPALDEYPLGYRWVQFFVGAFFSTYTLPSSLQTYSTMTVSTDEFTTGRFKAIGAGLGHFYNYYMCTGGSYGRTGFPTAYANMWLSEKSGTYTYSGEAKEGYYEIWSNISSPSMKALMYWYPSVVGFINVTGTSTLKAEFWSITNPILKVANGTEYDLTTFSDGVYEFGNEWMVTRNVTPVVSRSSWFVYSPSNTSWTFTKVSSTNVKIELQNQQDYNVTAMFLLTWKSFSDGNSTEVYNAMRTIVLGHHSITPIDYDTQISLWTTAINSVDDAESRLSVYETAISSTVKLIGHDNPLLTSITSWGYAEDRLTFVVDSSSSTSTTKIYCGSLGEPTNVGGASSWSYDSTTKILTVTTNHDSATTLTVDWGTAPPYISPSRYDYTQETWYLRSDTWNVSTVLGYKLHTTQSSTSTYINQTSASNVTFQVGVRIYTVTKTGTETEVTAGTPVALASISGVGSSTESATWTPDDTISFPFDTAIKVVFYTKIGSGSWTAKIVSISRNLVSNEIEASTWTIYYRMSKVDLGGSYDYRIYFGEYTSWTRIEDVSIAVLDPWGKMLYYLNTGNLIQFILSPFTYHIGDLFYGLVVMFLAVTSYNRYRKVGPIVVILFLFGGVGGALTMLIPGVGLNVSFLLLGLGLAITLMKLIR